MNYITYKEAFNKIGILVFGNKWTGKELEIHQNYDIYYRGEIIGLRSEYSLESQIKSKVKLLKDMRIDIKKFSHYSIINSYTQERIIKKYQLSKNKKQEMLKLYNKLQEECINYSQRCIKKIKENAKHKSSDELNIINFLKYLLKSGNELLTKDEVIVDRIKLEKCILTKYPEFEIFYLSGGLSSIARLETLYCQKLEDLNMDVERHLGKVWKMMWRGYEEIKNFIKNIESFDNDNFIKGIESNIKAILRYYCARMFFLSINPSFFISTEEGYFKHVENLNKRLSYYDIIEFSENIFLEETKFKKDIEYLEHNTEYTTREIKDFYVNRLGYWNEWLELQTKAIIELGITEDNQVTYKDTEEWLKGTARVENNISKANIETLNKILACEIRKGAGRPKNKKK